jgi:glutathione-specific gamma-glutamylcyclotransferase
MDSPAEPAPEGPTPLKPLRDPQALLLRTRREWGGRGDLWVFGYASLLWRPEFAYDEHRQAFVHGWHRALRMASRINRGTPERPGLVFAMLPGGSCHGGAFRVPRDAAPAVLELLWQREMPTGVYDPRWLPCRTPQGVVNALAFTLSRKSPQHTGRLPEPQLVEILRHSRGKYGTTLEYLVATAQCLAERGVRDREIERLMALTRKHGLA